MNFGRVLIAVAVACLTGCRRAPPAAPPPAPPPAAAARPEQPKAQLLPEAHGDVLGVPKSDPPPPAAAREAGPAGGPGVAETPAAAAASAAEPEDHSVYRWEDRQGGLHFGERDAIPPGARHVEKAGGNIVVLEQAPVPDVPTAAPAPSAELPAPPPPPPVVKGETPQRDADGLPIPGTMLDNAHTRAVRAVSGGQAPDPAAQERAHEEELRRLKCRVVDGATICG